MNENGTNDDLNQAILRLAARIEALEQRIGQLESEKVTAAASPSKPSTQLLYPRPARSSPAAGAGSTGPAVRKQAAPPPESALVAALRTFFLSGNPLNKIGAVTILISIALFFKAAADNNWVGPTGRVVLGILGGLLLFFAGEFVRKKGLLNIASGFIGAGAGVIYLSMWNAQHRYLILPGGLAFIVDLLLTIVILAQALRYDSQVVAVMGMLGGYLTPMLSSTGSNNFAALALFLFVFNAAIFALAYYRRWQGLKWLSFSFTEAYLVAWAFQVERYLHTTPPHFSVTLEWFIPFVAAFFLYFSALPAFRNISRKEPFHAGEIYLTVMNGVVNFALLYLLLSGPYRAYLGLAAVAVSAVYFYLCGLVLPRLSVDKRTFNTLLAVGAWFLFAAVPMIASKHYITIVWSFEAVLVAYWSTKERFTLLFPHVTAIMALIMLRLVYWDGVFALPRLARDASYFPLSDPGTLATAAAAVSFGLIARLTRDQKKWVNVYSPMALAVIALLSIAGWRESAAFVHLRFYDLVPHALIGSLTFAAWAAVTGAILVLSLSVIGAGRPVRSVIVWGFVVLLFLTLAALWDIGGYLRWGLTYPAEAAVASHATGFLVLLLFFAAYWLMAGKATGEKVGPKAHQLIWLGMLGLVLLFVRRELYSLAFLPPLSELIGPVKAHPLYHTSLSCLYSLLSFFLYLRGVKKQQREVIYVAYALFAVTGLKVYFYDLGSAGQLFRALSLLVFGLVLLVSEYAKKRMMNEREQ